MDEASKALLEAQVRHELARFKPRKFKQTLRGEVAALFDWLQTITLGELISAEQVLALIERNVVQRPLTAEVGAVARLMSRRVWASPQNRKTTIADICTRSAFDVFVAKSSRLDELRHVVIHRLVHSPVYIHQVSEMLFNGIKEYLLTENILAQRVPGLASLIKLGKFAVNKTMQPIEAAVEKAVKTYIEGNLGKTIRRSEQSINDYFDQARIAGMADALWEGVSDKNLSEFIHLIDAEDLDDFVDLGLIFWQEYRKTAYFRAIYTDLVQAYYAAYADTPLSDLAAAFGLNAKIVTAELAATLAMAANKALSSGYLEQRIRASLEDFYNAPETITLIAELAATGRQKPSPARKPKAARPASRNSAKSKPSKPAAAAKKAGK